MSGEKRDYRKTYEQLKKEYDRWYPVSKGFIGQKVTTVNVENLNTFKEKLNKLKELQKKFDNLVSHIEELGKLISGTKTSSKNKSQSLGKLIQSYEQNSLNEDYNKYYKGAVEESKGTFDFVAEILKAISKKDSNKLEQQDIRSIDTAIESLNKLREKEISQFEPIKKKLDDRDIKFNELKLRVVCYVKKNALFREIESLDNHVQKIIENLKTHKQKLNEGRSFKTSSKERVTAIEKRVTALEKTIKSTFKFDPRKELENIKVFKERLKAIELSLSTIEDLIKKREERIKEEERTQRKKREIKNSIEENKKVLQKTEKLEIDSFKNTNEIFRKGNFIPHEEAVYRKTTKKQLSKGQEETIIESDSLTEKNEKKSQKPDQLNTDSFKNIYEEIYISQEETTSDNEKEKQLSETPEKTIAKDKDLRDIVNKSLIKLFKEGEVYERKVIDEAVEKDSNHRPPVWADVTNKKIRLFKTTRESIIEKLDFHDKKNQALLKQESPDAVKLAKARLDTYKNIKKELDENIFSEKGGYSQLKEARFRIRHKLKKGLAYILSSILAPLSGINYFVQWSRGKAGEVWFTNWARPNAHKVGHEARDNANELLRELTQKSQLKK